MQIADIVIADAASTPLNHTFTPQSAQNGNVDPAVLLNRSGGIYAGFERLTILARRSESGRATKVSLKLVKPTLAVTSPATGSGIQPQPTVAYTCIGEMNFTFPDSSTLQERKDLRKLIYNLLASTAAVSAIEELSPLY